jgi:hypothetical protein
LGQKKENEPWVRFLDLNSGLQTNPGGPTASAVGLIAHQFRRPGHRNAAFDANGLAQLAADTFFLVDNGDLEKFGIIVAGLHGNAIEGTDVHAKFAGRAGIRVHLGLGDLEGLDLLDRFPPRVHDGFDRAMDAADAAVDAKGRVDVKNGFFFAGNGFRGALHRAKGAANAVVEDHVGQTRTPGDGLVEVFNQTVLKNERPFFLGKKGLSCH